MNDKKNWIILLIVVAVIAVGAFMIINSTAGSLVASAPADGTAAPVAEAGAYQAVFLVNNQVYFGKLANENSQFVTLTDIYYLQVNQQIQPKDSKEAAANPGVNLIKLGGELHGPTDEMKINRDQVLLIEDLRSDSNVVKAIDAYKTSQQKAKAPAAK